MEELECLRRRCSAIAIGLLGIFAPGLKAQPISGAALWQLNFPALANGKGSESIAVPLDNKALRVVVVTTGANPNSPQATQGGVNFPVKMVGHDPTSRLGFVRATGKTTTSPVLWADDAGRAATESLKAVEPARTTKCKATGWIKQVGGKVLPFALLQIEFTAAVPPPGTPLTDAAGRIVAIVFQGSGSGTIGYAIPSEAVNRVKQDLLNHGQLIRGWLGLALRADSQEPLVSRILPDSPAADAGIHAGDLLLSIGSRRITDYADAANAFFYLVPGQPVSVKLQRAGTPLEFTLTPVKPRS